MKKAYVTALTESILSGLDVSEALTNLRLVLKQKGHERLLSQILRATYRELEARLKTAVPQVTVATAEHKNDEAIASALLKLGAAVANQPNIKVDPTLVGGYTVRVKDSFIDASYKQSLLNLYRSIAETK